MPEYPARVSPKPRNKVQARDVRRLRFLRRDGLFLTAAAMGCGFWALLWWLAPVRPMSWQQAWSLHFASLAVIQPCLEEAVFRGFLQGLLLGRSWGQRAWGGLTAANCLTALVFATGHLVNHETLWAAAVIPPALAFGFFRDRYGSVWPGMALHVFYNVGYFALTGLPTAP